MRRAMPSCRFVASWACPSFSGREMVLFHTEGSPTEPGLHQLRRVHSSSYLFWRAVPVRPIRHKALTSFMALVMSDVRSMNAVSKQFVVYK